jgi:hypothetical protein
MKRLVVTDDAEGGLEALLGVRVTLFCLNYIYAGDLVAIGEGFVTLDRPQIVYETGPFDTPDWQDAQNLPGQLHVMLSAVESFGFVK